MKKILSLISASLLLITQQSIASDDYLFTDSYDIIPKDTNRMINKQIYLKPDIKTNFFIRINSFPSRNTLFVLFHGGKNNAIEFMQNTDLHSRINKEEYDFLLMPSYNSKDYISNYKENEIILNAVLNGLRGSYQRVVFLGYAEGGTFMTQYYCNNKDSRNIQRLRNMWNINGTIPKDCSISEDINYNLLYGTKMDLGAYYKDNEFYTDYKELSKNLSGNCNIEGYSTIHGSSMSEVYLEQASLRCKEPNDVNMFRAINMERNFPYTNKLELEGFQGAEIPNFDMINFIKRINYI